MASASFFSLISLVKIFSILTFFFTCNNAAKFSSILLFGDSLLDTGNNNFITTVVKANHPPYGMSFPGGVPTGRFSDGKLMSDLLAEALGIKKLVPPFLDPNLDPNELRTGVCFASGGSGYDDNTANVGQVISVTNQYKELFPSYKQKLIEVSGEQEAENIIKNTLVFATSGYNDLTISYLGGSMDAYQDFLLQNIQSFIKALYDGGLRNMAIAGLPGDVVSKGYNKKLIRKLAEVQTSLPGSKIVYADLATPLAEVTANPQTYGISEISGGCCGLGLPVYGGAPVFGPGCNVFIPTCTNPSHYFLWDTVHPTETVYRHVIDWFVKNLLPQFP